MFDLKNRLGVKSWSFREIKDNIECAKAIRYCGASVVDLSGSHIDYAAPDTWDACIAAYRDNGVTFDGVGAISMTPDEINDRKFFEFAKKSNSKLVSVSFAPDGWEVTVRILERLSEEYGIPVAIHNHGGYNWLGNSTMLRYVFNRTSRRIGLCLDTAWCMHVERENPIGWLNLFGNRTYGFHFKDFLWTREGKHEDVIVGEGALDLKGLLERVKTLENIQSAVVEYEGADAVERTKKSIENILSLY